MGGDVRDLLSTIEDGATVAKAFSILLRCAERAGIGRRHEMPFVITPVPEPL
jgi:hypothetical protein